MMADGSIMADDVREEAGTGERQDVFKQEGGKEKMKGEDVRKTKKETNWKPKTSQLQRTCVSIMRILKLFNVNDADCKLF